MMSRIFLIALFAGCFFSACGDGSSDPIDPIPQPRFGAQIAFGDSLSDVGTYAVGRVKELGGGKYTVNGDSCVLYPALTGKNWTELIAAGLGLPAPCAAQTGLDGNAALGFSVPVRDHAGCFGYAQGGARVTNPVGPEHKSTGSDLGALTVPVKTQIARHLALSGGKFKSNDIVLLMAGGNDLIMHLEALHGAAAAYGKTVGEQAYANSLAEALAAGATNRVTAAQAIRQAMATERAKLSSTDESVTKVAVATAANEPGNSAMADPATYGPLVRQAGVNAMLAGRDGVEEYVPLHSPEYVTQLATAGADLAALVKDQMLANGAQYVVINNLPDVSKTPAGIAFGEQFQPLLSAMAQAFNGELSRALNADSRVILIDSYGFLQEAAANPGAYGLSNVTKMACDMALVKNSLEDSLICTVDNLNAGDVSHYAFADDIHPTPYFNSLMAKQVLTKMQLRNWLPASL